MSANSGQTILQYWMNVIETKDPSAQVVLVGAFIDREEKAVPQWAQKYPQIKAIFPVNCLSGKGVDELRDFLVGLAVSQQISIPKTYLEVNSILHSTQEFIIPLIVLKEWITKNRLQLSDLQLNVALQTLHNMGYITYYLQSELSQTNFVILRPQLLLSVFKNVMSIQDAPCINGWLYRTSLELIWPEYNKSVHLFLLDILAKYKIAINCKDRSLLPRKLHRAPNYISEDLRFAGYLVKRFEFGTLLPPDLFPTIIASEKLFPFLEVDLIWRDTAPLFDFENRSVLLKSYGTRIDILGVYSERLVSVITNVIEEVIAKDWRGNSF